MISCPLCGDIKDKISLYDIDNVFVSNTLFSDKNYDELSKMKEVKNSYARGDCSISLQQCVNCGFIFNHKFNLEKMIAAYSSDDYCQQTNFTKQLNKHIIDTAENILSYIEYDKNTCIAEIASGQGDLTRALSQYVGHIYSIDPSPISNCIKDIKNVEYVQTFFNYDLMASKINKPIKLIVCRHVIEHIDKPREVLRDIVRLLEEDGILYIEVPDMQEIIEHIRFCDIYHDHCGYYQKNTLINIMPPNSVANLFYQAIASINNIMKNYKSIGIYGAGGNSNTFLNSVDDCNLMKIVKAFDKNEKKWGNFLQNTNIKIVEPSENSLKNLDCIIMVMPICEDIVFEREIVPFIQNGFFKGNIYKTADCSYLAHIEI